MPECEQRHVIQSGPNKGKIRPHKYVQGICLHSVTLPTKCWLLATFVMPDEKRGLLSEKLA